jgi:hypothetical protein
MKSASPKTTEITESNEIVMSNPPKIDFEIKPHFFKISKSIGDEIRLLCLDFKSTENIKIKWIKNGAARLPLKSNQSTFMNEYFIKKLRYRDLGTYECVVNGQKMLRVDLVLQSNMLKQQQQNLLVEFSYHNFEFYLFLSMFLITIVSVVRSLLIELNNLIIKKSRQSIFGTRDAKNMMSVFHFVKLNIEEFEDNYFNPSLSTDSSEKIEESRNDMKSFSSFELDVESINKNYNSRI